MDSAHYCYTGGLGSIPAADKSNVQYSDVFSPSRYKVVGYKWNQTH